jgi:hypothetical protein
MKCCREITIDDTDLRVYPSGRIWRFYQRWNKWFIIKSKPNAHGYLVININKKLYYVARIVAHAYFGFDLSSQLMIDHRDRKPLNNAVWNLRIVSNHENQFNKKSKGIYKDKNGWIGSICVNYNRLNKWFKTEEEALEWYKEMKKIHHVIPEPDYKKIMTMCISEACSENYAEDSSLTPPPSSSLP